MKKNEQKPKIRFKGFTDAWEQRKLKDMSTYKNGTGHEDKQSSTGKYELINLNSVSIDGGLKSSGKYIDESDETLQIDDLVMVLSDVGHGDLLGRVAVIPENNRFVLNQRVALLRPNDSVFPRFLFTCINAGQAYFKINGAGSSQLNISKEVVENFEPFIPKKDEQIKISETFEKIDNLITLHQRKCDKLVNIKKSLLEKMFPKNGNNVPEIRFKGFTEAWEQRKFSDVGCVSMCKRIFKTQTTDIGEVPFFKIGTFGKTADSYITKKLFNEYKAKFSYPEKGDILISASGSIGRIVEFSGKDEYFQDSNIVWLKHNKEISNEFLKQLYQIVKWYGIEGTTIQRLYNSNILNTEFKMPSIDEQNKISSLLNCIDNLITLHQRKLEQLKNVKKSLIEKMFV